MLSNTEFVRQSLELHLFFTRIMKEHSFFLEIGFTSKDSNLSHQADLFRIEFDKLLAEVISLSNGNVSTSVLQSGEVITPFTLKAETVTEFYTGIKIATNLTESESQLMGDVYKTENPIIVKRVTDINEKALNLIRELAQFKSMVLNKVLSCELFTNNYPLLIDHILREAKFYYQLVQRLQNREEVDLKKEAYEQETFWNRIMAEHAKFIRGLLDPTENELIITANNFGTEFDKLTAEAKAAMDRSMPISNISEESFKATVRIRDFKVAGTSGILDCKIRSIIIPLLGDHTLREANHYLRLLKIFTKKV
jgi:hypothetical protein